MLTFLMFSVLLSLLPDIVGDCRIEPWIQYSVYKRYVEKSTTGISRSVCLQLKVVLVLKNVVKVLNKVVKGIKFSLRISV